MDNAIRYSGGPSPTSTIEEDFAIVYPPHDPAVEIPPWQLVKTEDVAAELAEELAKRIFSNSPLHPALT